MMEYRDLLGILTTFLRENEEDLPICREEAEALLPLVEEAVTQQAQVRLDESAARRGAFREAATEARERAAYFRSGACSPRWRCWPLASIAVPSIRTTGAGASSSSTAASPSPASTAATAAIGCSSATWRAGR